MQITVRHEPSRVSVSNGEAEEVAGKPGCSDSPPGCVCVCGGPVQELWEPRTQLLQKFAANLACGPAPHLAGVCLNERKRLFPEAPSSVARRCPKLDTAPVSLSEWAP